MQELEFFICFSSLINRNEITLYFHPVYIFFCSLSINQMNINSYRFGWLAVIMTMMYRESNPNISSCCKECTNVCKTCSNIHYLIILSFTLILVAVTRNKIVTKNACSTLFECFFVQLKPSFLKVWFDPLKLYSLIQCWFLYSKDHVSVNLIFILKVVQRASQIQTYVNLVNKWYYFWKPRGKIKTFKRVFLLE